jgi:hypothetical protein
VVVRDRVRPFAIQVEVIANRVQIPCADSGRTTADFREPQSLRAEEPLHMGSARPDAESLVDLRAQLTELGVIRRRLDAIRGDELW